MCTVAHDLAISGSCASSASRMARCSASVWAMVPVWVSPRQTRALVVGAEIDSSSEESTELPEHATIRRWNSRSFATRSSASGRGPMLSSSLRRPSVSASVIRSAAIAVAAGSRMRRTRSSRGSRLVTYVPSPRRTSRMLTRDSARTASRSELRERPSSAARSASRGSRSPARSAPEVIMPLIFSMASSVTATARAPPFRKDPMFVPSMAYPKTRQNGDTVRIALHTRVRADRIDQYEAAHRAVPAELAEAIRAGGAQHWTIWRSGTDLFHVIECEDYAALLAYLNEQPVNAAWQARMAELLDVVHDYSAGGVDAALPVVWEL